jgi:septum formation protein
MPSTSETTAHLVLASASPRRADLLRTAGITFEVAAADIDERVHAGEDPATYVQRLAREKAARVAATRTGAFVLAADTTVVVDGEILGKPEDAADAGRMLRLLSGRRHEVLTGVCLTGPGPFERAAVVRTAVAFARLSEEEIAWYVATGEPLDKAGAYAVQGLASRFVERIEGSHPNVVGLPVELVYAWCREVGIRVS